MVLTPHILIGAVIIYLMKSKKFWQTMPVVLLSHYFLDMIPHWEYLDMSLSMERAWYRILLDLLIGFGLAFLFLKFSRRSFFLLCFAILPDVPIFLFSFWRNNIFLQAYLKFNDFLHFWCPAPVWLGISTQLIIIFISLIILFHLKNKSGRKQNLQRSDKNV